MVAWALYVLASSAIALQWDTLASSSVFAADTPNAVTLSYVITIAPFVGGALLLLGTILHVAGSYTMARSTTKLALVVYVITFVCTIIYLSQLGSIA